MKKLAIIVGMLLSLKANATGGFYCEVTDGNLKLAINGVTSRSFQGAVVDAGAELKGTFGDDGLIFNIDHTLVREDLRQYWSTDGEFRLVFYAEKENANSFEKVTTMTVKTKVGPDGATYDGMILIHQVQSGKEWSTELPITCSIE